MVKLSERMLDMHHRRVDRWSHVDQGTAGEAIWAVRSLEAIAEDGKALLEYVGICDHVDHHGYCQTHGLDPTDEDGLCPIGRLVIRLDALEGADNAN